MPVPQVSQSLNLSVPVSSPVSREMMGPHSQGCQELRQVNTGKALGTAPGTQQVLNKH